MGLMNASKFAAPKDFGRNDTDSRLGSASSDQSRDLFSGHSQVRSRITQKADQIRQS